MSMQLSTGWLHTLSFQYLVPDILHSDVEFSTDIVIEFLKEIQYLSMEKFKLF